MIDSVPRWRRLPFSTRAAACGAALLIAACSQSPGPAPGGGADVGATARGSRTAAQAPSSVAPANSTLFARLDGWIAEWDAAQGGGQIDQAAALKHQIGAEVDANYASLEYAARGQQGLAAQYLGLSALGFSSNPAATRMLVTALRSKDPQLVGNALIAIKLRADPETPLGPILARIHHREALAPRRYAPLALANVLDARAQIGRPSEGGTTTTALARLGTLLDDSDPVVRLHAARAFGALQTPLAVDPLRRLVGDDHARVQWAAAAAMERTGDIRGFSAVLELMHETPSESKHLIRDILVSYAGRIQQRPLTSQEIAQLGTGARAWSQWFSAHKQSRGIRPGTARAADLGG